MLNLLKVGKVLKTTGIEGTLRIVFKGPTVPLTEELKYLFLSIKGSKVPYEIIKSSEENYSFKNIDNPEIASLFVGGDIFLEDFNCEVNHSTHKTDKLVGYKVYNKDGSINAKLIEIIDYGMHQNLLIDIGNQEYLVPFHNDLIISIDNIQQIVILDITEDLLLKN